MENYSINLINTELQKIETEILQSSKRINYTEMCNDPYFLSVTNNAFKQASQAQLNANPTLANMPQMKSVMNQNNYFDAFFKSLFNPDETQKLIESVKILQQRKENLNASLYYLTEIEKQPIEQK